MHRELDRDYYSSSRAYGEWAAEFSKCWTNIWCRNGAIFACSKMNLTSGHFLKIFAILSNHPDPVTKHSRKCLIFAYMVSQDPGPESWGINVTKLRILQSKDPKDIMTALSRTFTRCLTVVEMVTDGKGRRVSGRISGNRPKRSIRRNVQDVAQHLNNLIYEFKKFPRKISVPPKPRGESLLTSYFISKFLPKLPDIWLKRINDMY